MHGTGKDIDRATLVQRQRLPHLRLSISAVQPHKMAPLHKLRAIRGRWHCPSDKPRTVPRM